MNLSRVFFEKTAVLKCRLCKAAHLGFFSLTFFLLPDISFISVSGHDAQLSWSASGVEDQIQGCVVLYKKTQVRKPLWSFKRTLQQNQTSLVSLLPLTNYTAWVLCYTSTGKVYGSNTIHFVTIGGTVSRN